MSPHEQLQVALWVGGFGIISALLFYGSYDVWKKEPHNRNLAKILFFFGMISLTVPACGAVLANGV